MRILVVVALALVALGAGGVWALGQFGDSFTSVASEPREPVVLEPQVTFAANEAAAAHAAAPTPAPSKPAAKPASKPAAPKSEPAKAQPSPAPAQQTAPAAAETQAAPAPPPPPEAAPATPTTPAKPNPFKANSLDSSKPADALSQLLPGAKPAAPSAPAADAPAASAPAASTPAAPAQSAPSTATAQAAPAQPATKVADPILKPQQVDAPPAANVAAAAATGLQAQLKSRAITYNRPPAKLALNKVVDVTLVINATEDTDAGKQALQGSKGEIVERNVDLSDNVSAQLTALGGGFKITPLTIDRQKLSGKMINRWQWSVEPTEIGTHTLILDIFGYESGSLDAEQLANYQDKITVEVQQLDQVIGWAKGVQPLFAVLAALAGITSASVAFMRFRDERKAKKAAKSS